MRSPCILGYYLPVSYSVVMWRLCQDIRPAKPHLRLVMRHFKHQKGDRPVVLKIFLAPTIFSGTYLRRYIRYSGSTPGQLFLFAGHSHVTRFDFATQLSAYLMYAGRNPQFYKYYSFRIGAATTATSKGFTYLQILQIGR